MFESLFDYLHNWIGVAIRRIEPSMSSFEWEMQQLIGFWPKPIKSN